MAAGSASFGTVALSVVVPCTRPGNAGNIIGIIAAQAGSAVVEIIIVGDAPRLPSSPRKTDVIVIPCLDSHTNVRRNLGIARSRGERVAFLDDDAFPIGGWLEAALSLDPREGKVLVGPELPAAGGKASLLVYAVCSNFFTEGDRAHFIRSQRRVLWTEAPFCNWVAPRWLFDRVGLPSVNVPWDMDDIEFCYRCRKHVDFVNLPQLAIRHDRYPDSYRSFLADKWTCRVRTGEKVVYAPEIFFRKPPVVAGLVFPYATFAVWALFPGTLGEAALFWGAGYGVFLLTQAVRCVRHVGKSRIPQYLALMAATQAVSVAAVQVGFLRGVLRRLEAWR